MTIVAIHERVIIALSFEINVDADLAASGHCHLPRHAPEKLVLDLQVVRAGPGRPHRRHQK